jgi:tRNA modification GTPase
LLSVFRAPHSYTGEDALEISAHGNPYLVDRILSNMLQYMDLAKPGEFTLRAYLNGKMDLSQAEAVNDLITAATSKAEAAALMQVKGYLSRHLEALLERLGEARIRCELAIDFADQDLPSIDLQDLAKRIDSLISDANGLYSEGQHSRKLREGIKICLAGAPNAGKSSLFNAFLKQNRAIVSPHPGTTRDYLEESFSLSGYPIVLYDTAGLRQDAGEIEAEGISRSHQLMREADLILYLYERAEDLKRSDFGSVSDKILFVASKADLARHQELPQGHIPCSVEAPDGLKPLSGAILNRLQLPSEVLYRPLVTNARHLAALKRCLDALDSAQTALAQDAGFEFIAFDLKAAATALEDILGVVSSEDLLNQIFSGFCIGK